MDVRMDMCRDTNVGMWIDMYIDMYIRHMNVVVCVDMPAHMRTQTCAYRHVYTDM